MNRNKLMLTLVLAATSQQAMSHGLMDYPKARQQFCAEQGGYWWPDDGSAIPNQACRAAFLESGTVQFVQNHEFSINISDFRNQAQVRASIPDGKLCAAADPSKRGMDLPSADWQRTSMKVAADGTLELLFAAHTPHNPSFWQFFLSSADFDASREALSWGKLELIDELGDQPITVIGDKKYYRIKVRVPAGRSGKATLYTRWQRDDVAGEGFYNCSDIVLEQDGTPEPEWRSLGSFIPSGLKVAEGDELWFRVFDADGRERVFERRIVSQDEAAGAWVRNLAQQVAQATTLVAVGVRQDDGSVVFSEVVEDNRVWTKDAGFSYRLDLKSAAPSVVLAGLSQEYSLKDGKVTVSFTLEASRDTAVGLSVSKDGSVLSDDSLTLTAGSTPRSLTLTAPGNYQLALALGNDVSRYSFSVTETADCRVSDPDASNYPAWSATKTYNGAEKVSFESLVWRANWWNQGSSPSRSNGAWSLVSRVVLPWDTAASYNQGQQAGYGGHLWQALWWSKGETPGVSGAWQDLGIWQCSSK